MVGKMKNPCDRSRGLTSHTVVRSSFVSPWVNGKIVSKLIILAYDICSVTLGLSTV